jgi:hypothetical protein
VCSSDLPPIPESADRLIQRTISQLKRKPQRRQGIKALRGAGVPPATFPIATHRKKRRRDAGATIDRAPLIQRTARPAKAPDKKESVPN